MGVLASEHPRSLMDLDHAAVGAPGRIVLHSEELGELMAKTFSLAEQVVILFKKGREDQGLEFDSQGI